MFDGAMGTQLQMLGIADKPCPEYASVINPDAITNIHKKYVAAGAQIIETNTFGANAIKLANFDLQNEIEKIIVASVKAARNACDKDTLLAGSVGPTGKLIHPLGDTSFDEICSVYEEQIKVLANSSVDYILLETIIDIQEMRAAVLAAKSVTNIPIIAQMTFEADKRSVTGTDVITAAAILEPLGVSVLGMNCSLGPEQLLSVVEELASVTSLPISIQPNAGLPTLVNGETVFPLAPKKMALWVPKLVAAGANFIGGCCGTTPEHIAAMAAELKKCKAAERPLVPKGVRLASRSKSVLLGSEHNTVLIGERINPTGRKAMAEELKSGSFLTVKKEAIDQVEAGAKVLDINMGVPGVDQVVLMKKAVEELSSIVDAPFSIDSPEPAVLEAGLRYFPGRALINSVSGKQPLQKECLQLAKKYGAAIIVLPLEKNLPKTAEEKVALAREIVKAAKEEGLTDNDIVLDALVMTAATDGKAPGETLKTLRLYREEFGYPSTMGLSNVSFGLPQRELINTAFFLMCLASGLDAPIINPSAKNIRQMLAAASVINGKDSQGTNYSLEYANIKEDKSIVAEEVQDVLAALTKAVMRGEKEVAGNLAVQAHQEGHQVFDIANNALTKAMEQIGDKFAQGKAFLPQLMLAAEAMKTSFDVLKERLKPEEQLESKGKVVVATVEGDIHDLGKNIVATLLKNSGFTVIDLGKDVPADEVLRAVEEEKPDIVGLCALMTTTLGSMEECVEKLHKKGYNGGIMVGGAVLTADYAQEINTDMYAKDGVAAVNLAKSWVEKKLKF